MGEACRHECVIRTRELETRLAAVEAERDRWKDGYFDENRKAATESRLNLDLKASLAAVEAERDGWADAAGGLKDAEANTRARLAAVTDDRTILLRDVADLRARLAAVLALLDEHGGHSDCEWCEVRAAAQGKDDRG